MKQNLRDKDSFGDCSQKSIQPTEFNSIDQSEISIFNDEGYNDKERQSLEKIIAQISVVFWIKETKISPSFIGSAPLMFTANGPKDRVRNCGESILINSRERCLPFYLMFLRCVRT